MKRIKLEKKQFMVFEINSNKKSNKIKKPEISYLKWLILTLICF